eukprot:gene18932-12391_t
MSMALQNDHVKDTSASADRFPGVHREEQDLREELLLTEKYFNKIVEVLKILLPASSTDASKRSPLHVMLETSNWHSDIADREPKLLQLLNAALLDQLSATDLANNTLLHYALKYTTNSSAVCFRIFELYPDAVRDVRTTITPTLDSACSAQLTARSLDDRVPLAILDAYPAAARAVPTVVTGSLCGVTGDGSFQKKKKKRWLNRAEMQRLAEEKEAAAAYPYIPRTMLSLALSEWSNGGSGNTHGNVNRHCAAEAQLLRLLEAWPDAVKDGYCSDTTDGEFNVGARAGGRAGAEAGAGASPAPRGLPTVLHIALQTQCPDSVVLKILEHWPAAVMVADPFFKQTPLETATFLLNQGQCSPALFMALASAYIEMQTLKTTATPTGDVCSKGAAATRIIDAASAAYENAVVAENAPLAFRTLNGDVYIIKGWW